MKLEKTFTSQKKTFKFLFSHKPYFTDENTIVMGYPLNMMFKQQKAVMFL